MKITTMTTTDARSCRQGGDSHARTPDDGPEAFGDVDRLRCVDCGARWQWDGARYVLAPESGHHAPRSAPPADVDRQ